MSEYDLRPGGSLKLKGGVVEGGIVKKKKKKSKRKEEEPSELELERRKAKEILSKQEIIAGSPSGSSRNSPAIVSSGNGNGNGPRKTEAERRFEEVQKKRLEQKVAKLAGKTHKDRVNEFNAKLEQLSEHHDIPKVGPG